MKGMQQVAAGSSLQPRTPRFSLWRRMKYSARRVRAFVLLSIPYAAKD